MGLTAQQPCDCVHMETPTAGMHQLGAISCRATARLWELPVAPSAVPKRSKDQRPAARQVSQSEVAMDIVQIGCAELVLRMTKLILVKRTL